MRSFCWIESARKVDITVKSYVFYHVAVDKVTQPCKTAMVIAIALTVSTCSPLSATEPARAVLDRPNHPGDGGGWNPSPVNLSAGRATELFRQLSAVTVTDDTLSVEDLEHELQRLKKIIKEMEKDIERNKERRHDLQSRMDEAESDIERNKERRHDLQNRVDDIEKHRVSGGFQMDWAHFAQDPQNRMTIGDVQDGSEIRRARVKLSGALTDLIDYELEFSLTGDDREGGPGEVSFVDVFAEFKEFAPLGSLRVGHFKEPFSLEQQAGSSSTTFMERSLADAFTPGRNLGLMLRSLSPEENASISVGIFASNFDAGLGTSIGDASGLSGGTRLTWLPVYDEASDGRGLIHLGAAYNYHDEQDNSVRFRERPESNLADFFASTGRFDAAGYHLVGLEAAMVYGPFSLQSEYIVTNVNQLGGPAVTFDGFYVYGSYFLTGEHRRYRRSQATFRGPEVFEDFFSVHTPKGICRGRGAWEVAVRWSYLDLRNRNINDEILSDITVGLNWYLNDDMRVMWNFINADLNDERDPRSHANIYQMRFQLVF